MRSRRGECRRKVRRVVRDKHYWLTRAQPLLRAVVAADLTPRARAVSRLTLTIAAPLGGTEFRDDLDLQGLCAPRGHRPAAVSRSLSVPLPEAANVRVPDAINTGFALLVRAGLGAADV